MKLKFTQAPSQAKRALEWPRSPLAWRRSTLQRAANSCTMSTIVASALAGAANNNLGPSSQDGQGRRGPTNGWAAQALASGRCRGELLLIDLGTLQPPLPPGTARRLQPRRLEIADEHRMLQETSSQERRHHGSRHYIIPISAATYSLVARVPLCIVFSLSHIDPSFMPSICVFASMPCEKLSKAVQTRQIARLSFGSAPSPPPRHSEKKLRIRKQGRKHTSHTP